MQRCDLILIAHATTTAPELKVNDTPTKPSRKAAGKDWSMTSFDLGESRGKQLRLEATGQNLEGWLVMDRPINATPADPDVRLPMPIAQGYIRQSVRIFGSDSR